LAASLGSRHPADLTTTGDGILTGLHLAALVAASGESRSRPSRTSSTRRRF